MKRHQLSPKGVEKKREPGYYGDGAGLYLQVSAAGTKSWIFRFTLRGRAREMGLGPFPLVGLGEARVKAQEARKLLLDGIDPIEARKAKRAAEALEAGRRLTFAECAERYINAHEAAWRNAKHRYQWEQTLGDAYCAPIRALSVADVDTGRVLSVLEPIWTAKPETASRLRARLERVLDWATTRGYREGENPARWRGHLSTLLPAIATRRRVQHHPALPYAEIGAFVEKVRAQEGTAARALEFAILTAARTGEALNARPEEFDLDAGVWTVPAERMKSGREHRVPLSHRAVELIRAQPAGAYVFPGGRKGRPLSSMAMLMLLRRMKQGELTVHGFRSTFRDWAAECTGYPREVAEAALAHVVPDAVEAAYRRGDFFEKRRRLMAEWARQCDEGAAVVATVAPIRKAAG